MATNFSNSNVKQTVVQRFFEGLHSVSEQWSQAYDYRRDDIADLRISPISGVGEIPQWDPNSDLSVQTLEALNPQPVTYTAYGTQVRINKFDAMDVPESTQALPQRMGIAAASTYAKKAAGLLNNAFGTTTTSVDGLPLCATNHAVKGGGTRSNKLSSALDSAAILAAIALFRTYKDYQGLPMDVAAMGGFYLVIPPGLEEAAGQALGSAVTSNQNQLNMAGSYGIDTVIWNHLTDADNWFLVSKAMTPLVFWERSAIDLKIDIDEDFKGAKYSLDFAIGQSASAIPDGIVGSEV